MQENGKDEQTQTQARETSRKAEHLAEESKNFEGETKNDQGLNQAVPAEVQDPLGNPSSLQGFDEYNHDKDDSTRDNEDVVAQVHKDGRDTALVQLMGVMQQNMMNTMVKTMETIMATMKERM